MCLRKLKELDSFYDKEVNYAFFSGRITDRDSTANIFKVTSENKNIKFLRSGDELYFSMPKKDSFKQCKGYVRSTEPDYFVFYATNIGQCWEGREILRIGTALVFESEAFAERVHDAGIYRLGLIKRRKDFLEQLNEVNHFLWSFDQQKIQVGQDYDIKIARMEKAKQDALEILRGKRIDRMRLQKELMYQLDALDKDLEYYRIENAKLYFDRWHLDQDLGLPVGKRPQEVRPKKNNVEGRIEFYKD